VLAQRSQRIAARHCAYDAVASRRNPRAYQPADRAGPIDTNFHRQTLLNP
jgi:hypothetical protein